MTADVTWRIGSSQLANAPRGQNFSSRGIVRWSHGRRRRRTSLGAAGYRTCSTRSGVPPHRASTGSGWQAAAIPGLPYGFARVNGRTDKKLKAGVPAPGTRRGLLYALTADGRELEAVVIALARWGTPLLGQKQPGQLVPSSTLAITLRAAFNPGEAHGITASWEIRTARCYPEAARARWAATLSRFPQIS